MSDILKDLETAQEKLLKIINDTMCWINIGGKYYPGIVDYLERHEIKLIRRTDFDSILVAPRDISNVAYLVDEFFEAMKDDVY